MLHFSGGVAFGVNVGNLLELQRALERDRKVNPAAEVEEVARIAEISRECLARLRTGPQNFFDLRGYAAQLFHQGHRARRIKTAAKLSEFERQQEERGQLRRECLGGGHADLRARVSVDSAM